MESSETADVRPRPPFFPLGLVKLLLLGLSTFGLYQLIWFFLHWRHIRDVGGERISPAMRAVVIPQVFVFPLAYRIGKAVPGFGVWSLALALFAATAWAVLLLLSLAAPSIPPPLVLVPLLPLVGLQAMANRVNRLVASGHDPNTRLTRWGLLVVVLGGLLFLLGTIASVVSRRAHPAPQARALRGHLEVPVMAQERSPTILQIYRDFLSPGREADYKAVEEDAARICAELNFPHPHLAIESLRGPKEVWWLNAFGSEADKQRVADEYAKNPTLVAALAGIARRREGLTGTPMDIFANYRADLSRGAPWKVAGARFFAVTIAAGDPRVPGSVFDAPDGTRFIFRPFATRRQADAVAPAAGPGTRVFAVRPYWGMPEKQWIAADPAFWKVNPMAILP